MRIILSPSKTMKEPDIHIKQLTKPLLIPDAQEILARLRQFDAIELQQLMRMNEKLAMLNWERYQELKFDDQGWPAILAYDGIQYKSIGAEEFTAEEQQRLQEQVRVLSGLYGIVRPYDSIYPYRLEMQTKLSVGGFSNLYQFWGRKIYEHLTEHHNLIINLASKEYSKVIEPFIDSKVTFITCIFKTNKNGTVKIESTQAKKARGLMVRYIIKNGLTTPEQLTKFNDDGYHYQPALSNATEYVFIK